MDDKKNNDMSVDELLEKLRASLQTENEPKKEPANDSADDDIMKVVAKAIGGEKEEEKPKEAPIEAPKEEPLTEAEAEPEAEVEAETEAEAEAETEAEAEAEAEAEPEPIFVPTFDEEDDLVPPTFDEEEKADFVPTFDDEEEVVAATAQVEEEPAVAHINEEDILAAWGIDRADIKKTQTIDIPVAPKEEEAPATSATKVYRIARVESKEDFKARKQTETQKKSVDYDRVDYSLIKQALGIEKPEDDTLPMFEVDEPSEPKTINEPKAEFTYQRQREDIEADYSSRRKTSLIKLVLSAVFALALFLVECMPSLGVGIPFIFSVDKYPVVYSMATLQLMLLCVAVSYNEIANGFFSLLKFKITSGSLLLVLSTVSLVCGVVNCALGTVAPDYYFSVAFLALIVRLFEYLDVRREMYAFEVASSTNSTKYVASEVPFVDAKSVEGLEDYVGDDALVLKTEKCAFVENYFARTQRRSDSDIAANKYLLPLMLLVAVISFIIITVSGKGGAYSFSAFNLTFAVSIPVFVLLSAAFPMYKAVRKLYQSESTIIGESAVDEYSGTTMICFDDADAFPSYGVALENLRIYGSGDIETIIEQMGAVFSKLGGPLKNVFALMTTDCPKPYKVKIDGVFNDGINATVDGKKLFVGNADYMQANGFTVVDKSNEIGGKRFSTMYLAEDSRLCAKFYIRYTLDGGFESIIKKLARRGISTVILTGDSNINDELLARSIDISKLPVKVVRRTEFEGTTSNNRADSGVVSRSGVGGLVSAVTMCDKLAGVIGTMRAVRIASAVICALLVAGASLFAMSSLAASAYVLIYHLLWLIPAWLVAKINL